MPHSVVSDLVSHCLPTPHNKDARLKLEDLKCSPDLLNYHIWGLLTFWSSDLNNLIFNPSNSPVISEKQMFR